MSKILNKKIVGLLMFVLVMVIAVTGCSNSSEEEVIARVGEVTITKGEFYDELVKYSGSQVLDALVADKIMELEAEKLNVSVSEEKIEEGIEEMRDYYGSEEALNNELDSRGLTLDDIRNNLRSNYLIEALLEPYLNITEDDMKEYFEKNKKSFDQEEQVKASHILVETEEEALDIKKKLDEGEDFAELAKEYSTDKSSGALGGSLGTFNRERMVKEFSDAAFSLPVGEISDPVKSEYGYHIILVEEKIEAKEATYEEFKDNVNDRLKQERFYDAYAEWYQEKIEEYDIISYLK